MYAVIETGGKQYRVEVGTELEVELIDAEPGNTIQLERVLLVADGDDASIGQPVVANAAVSAEVLRQIRGEKTISFKYRPKARSRVKKGHRQELMVLRISDITLDGKSAAEAARKAEDDARTERTRLEEAAAKQAEADAALAAKLAKAAAKTEEPPAEAKAPAKGKAKATSEASTETEAAAETPTEAEAETETKPKRTRAKAADADAGTAPDETPKRTRATKKDE